MLSENWYNYKAKTRYLGTRYRILPGIPFFQSKEIHLREGKKNTPLCKVVQNTTEYQKKKIVCWACRSALRENTN